jgi:serine/threonine protein kinase
MVLEYVAGANLEQHRCGQAEALLLGARVADAIAYLGRLPSPIAHADIKPANIVVSSEDGRVVLVDFGSAVQVGRQGCELQAAEHYGTPGFAAPEQYRGEVSSRSDVYGLAATLYLLLTGDDPSTHPLAFPQLAALPQPVSALLTRALDQQPELRPTPAEFAARLRELAHERV